VAPRWPSSASGASSSGRSMRRVYPPVGRRSHRPLRPASRRWRHAGARSAGRRSSGTRARAGRSAGCA
jgi:hypothetical protein